jgi:hypothetical protein
VILWQIWCKASIIHIRIQLYVYVIRKGILKYLFKIEHTHSHGHTCIQSVLNNKYCTCLQAYKKWRIDAAFLTCSNKEVFAHNTPSPPVYILSHSGNCPSDNREVGYAFTETVTSSIPSLAIEDQPSSGRQLTASLNPLHNRKTTKFKTLHGIP